jgi:hypothetical protein
LHQSSFKIVRILNILVTGNLDQRTDINGDIRFIGISLVEFTTTYRAINPSSQNYNEREIFIQTRTDVP